MLQKKTFFAALALAPFAVLAQSSSVTVFGVMDLSARYVKNEGAGSMKSLASGNNATSRLGFKGSEDLGDGLSASFHLEAGLLADTGVNASATQFWDRRSTVSLASTKLGELRLGRDFVPTYLSWSRFDPFGYVGVASTSNLVSGTPVGPIRAAFGTGLNTAVRSSNAIQYLLPSGLGGVEGGVLVAAGEGGTAASGQDKMMSIRLGYISGPANFSAAIGTTENDVTANNKFRDSTFGGSYDFGVAKVNAAWRQFKMTTSKQTNLLIAATAPIGLGAVSLSYNRVNLDGKVGTVSIDANDVTQWGLGYVYNFSKRTVLYASAAEIRNDGAATFVIPGGPAIAGGGRTSTAFEAGVRHSF